MRLGSERVLDPIHITGEGPKGRGIFADTSMDELFPEDKPVTRKLSWGLLILASGALYIAGKK